MPNAQIDLYLQGATVSADAVVASTGAVQVYDAGALYGGALIQAGPGGPIYSVSTVDNPRQVTLQNVNGTTLTIAKGTRLIVLSSRPTAYSNAFATGTPLGSTITADDNGQAAVFLPEGSYDYIITNPHDASVTLDTPSPATISGAMSTMTINHTVGSGQTALLVAIAWQEPSETDTLDSVVCGSTPMTRIGTSLFLDLYGLVNPPAGAQVITATWSGSNTKAAVGQAICVSSAYPDVLPGLTRDASGSGTTASVTNAGAIPKSLLLAAMGVNIVTGTTTETPIPGATSLWSAYAGGSTDRTQANGASRPSTNAPTSIGWTLGASRAWGILSVEILPPWLSLITDARCATPFGIVATVYQDLRAAIDALGPQGGTLCLPNGDYVLDDGIVIDRERITLIGESQSVVIKPATANLFDLITVNAAHFRMCNLTLDGLATSQDKGAAGKSCLVMNGLGTVGRVVLGCALEDVHIQGAPKYGLLLRDTILATFENCEFVSNWYDGVRLQTESEGVVGIRFIGCAFSQNHGRGMSVKNCNTLLIAGCNGEGNSQDGVTGTSSTDGSTIYCEDLGVNVAITASDFEGPGGGTAVDNLIYFTNSYACSISNCNFNGGANSVAGAVRGLRSDLQSSFIETRCCSWTAFQATADGATIPADAVAALLGANCTSSLQNIDMSAAGHTYFVYVPNGSIAAGVVSIVVSDGARPPAGSVTPGTLIWVVSPTSPNTHLQMANGASGWVNVA